MSLQMLTSKAVDLDLDCSLVYRKLCSIKRISKFDKYFKTGNQRISAGVDAVFFLFCLQHEEKHQSTFY